VCDIEAPGFFQTKRWAMSLGRSRVNREYLAKNREAVEAAGMGLSCETQDRSCVETGIRQQDNARITGCPYDRRQRRR